MVKDKWHADVRKNRYYATRTITLETGKKRNLYLHKIIWEAHNGPVPKQMEIDHINGNGLDNRLGNLRICSHTQNMWNICKSETRFTSRFKGVSWDKRERKWVAKVKKNSVCNWSKSFKVELEAAKAYNLKAWELFGEYAKLNRLEGVQG